MTVDRLCTHGRSAAAFSCALVSVLICIAAVAAGSARADAFTWLGPTPLISTGANQNLPTVSCPSASQCTTVDGHGEQITFNGTSVITRSAIDLIGSVNALSCPSATQCTAVDNGGNEITFNPTTGAINAAGRNAIDAPQHLVAVSCASATVCSAVDSSNNLVTFDPSSGAVKSSFNISGGTDSAVSCVANGSSGQQCVIVGSIGYAWTAEIDTNGMVSGVTAYTPDAGNAGKSIACVSTTQCTAVDAKGNEVTYDPTTGFITGALTSIDTNGGTGVALSSVSCPSASVCVAVDGIGNEVTFAPTATPAPSLESIDGTTFIAAVSCPATGSTCTAVDNQGQETTFTPGSGTVASHGSIGSPALAGVSCPTRTQCTTVASGTTEVTFNPTSGAVNGAGAKAIDTSGNPMTGVSCVSSTECTAVDGGGNEITFDPTTGNVIANGFFAVDTSPLTAVACQLVSGSGGSSAPQCTTVDTSGGEVTFNPSSSTINNAGLSPIDGSGGLLQAISCAAGNQCTAVDSKGNEVTFDPTTGIYFGTQRWVSVDSGHSLSGVACLVDPSQPANATTPATQCTAVDTAGGVITFKNPAATPTIPARQTIEVSAIPLNAIACPSLTQCTAVDALGAEATFSPASTSLSSTLLTPLPQANSLSAIACQSISICVAVDADGNGFAGIVRPSNQTLPTISGTPVQQGSTLTEVNGTWTNFPNTYLYQWFDCPTASSPTSNCTPVTPGVTPASNGTGATYVPQASDIGSVLRVQETASNQGGPGAAVFSAPTSVVTPSPASYTVRPTITSTSSLYQQGQALAAQQGTWTEASNATLTYSYQWERCDSSGAHCHTISGATGQNYTPTASDVGSTLRALETADNGGTPVPDGVPSLATPVVQHAPPVKTTAAQITGSPVQQGQELGIREGTWTNTDGSTTYSYQWLDCDASGHNCQAITGATGQTYTPTTADVGDTLVVLESVDNGGQPLANAVPSAPSSVVLPTAPANASPPTIGGQIQQGTALTEGHGMWSTGVDAPTSYSYQWESCTASGTGCVAIAGATGQSYTPTTSEVGHAIVVVETASNAGGSSAPVASVATAPAAAAPPPAIQAFSRNPKPVTPNAATLQAVLATQGQAVTWQFVYGTSTNYSAGTPIQGVAAGGATSVPVQWALTNLKPDTTYHFRIVENVAATQYTPAATAVGQDLTFKTSSLGKIALTNTRLKVSPAGTVAVSLACQSAVECVDRFSLTTTTQVGHGGSRHLGSVLCNTALTRLPANTKRSATVTLTGTCLALLMAAPGRTLAATFTTRPRSGQLGLVAKITLVGPTALKTTKKGTRAR